MSLYKRDLAALVDITMAELDGGDYYGGDEYAYEGDIADDHGSDDGSVLPASDVDPYGYMHGTNTPLVLNEMLLQMYPKEATLHSPSLPSKERRGVYDQLFISTVVAGHSTRVLVGDSETSFPVVVSATMEYLPRESNLTSALGILCSRLGKALKDGIYYVHGSTQVCIESEGECKDLLPMSPLSVAESKLSEEVMHLDLSVTGSKSSVAVDAREQRLTHGVPGIVENNTAVTMQPGLAQWQVSPEERSYRAEWKGFMCPLRTSLGASGGCWRSTTAGVSARVCHRTVLQQLDGIYHSLSSNPPCERVGCDPLGLWLGGVRFLSCVCVSGVLRERFHAVPYHVKDRLTFHRHGDKRDVVISYNTGCLMKPVAGVGYVDNIMLQQNMSALSYEGVPSTIDTVYDDNSQLLGELSCLVPYMAHNPPARSSLSSHFIVQGLSPPCNTVNYQCAPQYSQSPLVITKYAMSMFPALTDMPGLNVRVAFMQTDLTFEDAFLMSASCALRFRYKCTTVVPVTDRELETRPVGSVIEPCSERWWAIPVPGVVVGKKVISTGEKRMIVSRTCSAVTGDKFASAHGQKGVVTVMPDNLMPLLPTGETAEVVIGTTTLMKRGTVGQLLECYASTLEGVDYPIVTDGDQAPAVEIVEHSITDRIPSCHDAPLLAPSFI